MPNDVALNSIEQAFDIAHGQSDQFTRARAAVERTLNNMKDNGILDSYEGKSLAGKSGCMERV